MTFQLSGFRRSMICLACASLVLSAVRTAIGAPDGANPQDLTQPQKPAEVAEVSAASLADLSQAARATGIPLPPGVTVGGIERQFPFIGAGGLDAKRPIGVIYFARSDWNVALGDGVAILLPLKPDAAPLSSFINAGGVMAPGHPDTTELNAATFRRSAGHLIFSKSAAATLAVRDTELPDLYKPAVGGMPAEPLLADLMVDMAALKRVNPEKFRKFFEEAGRDEDNDWGRQAGRDAASYFIRSLGRVDLQLRRGVDDLKLRLVMGPLAVPAPSGSLDKPDMPRDVVVRLDAAAAPLKLKPMIDAFEERLAGAAIWNGKAASPEVARHLSGFFQAVPDVFLDGVAVSVGIVPKPDGMLVYGVQIQSKPGVGMRMQHLADEFNAMSQVTDRPDNRSSAVVEHYAEGNLEVTRLRLITPGKQEVVIDAAEAAGKVYLTGTDEPGHHLATLVNLPSRGKMSGLVTGQVDLERAWTVVSLWPNSGLANIPQESRDALARAVKGQVLDFSANGEGDSLAVGVSVPQAILKQVAGLLLGGQ